MPATTINEMARATVACYQSEFPGDGPDWTSDWWVEAWRIDTDNQADAPEFSAYLDACKAAW